MTSAKVPNDIVNDLRSGTPVYEIQVRLFRMPIYERYSALCRACSQHKEIAVTCRETSEQVETLLSLMCPFHFPYRTCDKPIVEIRPVTSPSA